MQLRGRRSDVQRQHHRSTAALPVIAGGLYPLRTQENLIKVLMSTPAQLLLPSTLGSAHFTWLTG